MSSRIRRALCIGIVIVLGISCSTTMIRFTPYENVAIGQESSVTVKTLDGKNIVVYSPALGGQAITGTEKNQRKISIPFSEVDSVYAGKHSVKLPVLYGVTLFFVTLLAIM